MHTSTMIEDFSVCLRVTLFCFCVFLKWCYIRYLKLTLDVVEVDIPLAWRTTQGAEVVELLSF